MENEMLVSIYRQSLHSSSHRCLKCSLQNIENDFNHIIKKKNEIQSNKL